MLRSPTPNSDEHAEQRLIDAGRTRELILFCRQLGTMINVGTDILRGLTIVQDQVSHPSLRTALETARNDMTLGWTLALSLGRYPHLFSPFFIDMIRQGEGEGRLGEALNNLADYLEKEMRIETSAPANMIQSPIPAFSPPSFLPIERTSPITSYRLAVWMGCGLGTAALVWGLVTELRLLSYGAAGALATAIIGFVAASWGASEIRGAQLRSNSSAIELPESPASSTGEAPAARNSTYSDFGAAAGEASLEHQPRGALFNPGRSNRERTSIPRGDHAHSGHEFKPAEPPANSRETPAPSSSGHRRQMPL